MPGRLWQGNGGTQAPQRGPGVGRCAGWRPAGSAWPHPEGQPCAGPQERVAEATATLENPPGLGPPAPGLTQSWAGSRRTFGSRHGPPALALSGCSGQGLPAGHAHESHVAGSAPWQGLALDAHAAALLSSWGCREEDPGLAARPPGGGQRAFGRAPLVCPGHPPAPAPSRPSLSCPCERRKRPRPGRPVERAGLGS